MVSPRPPLEAAPSSYGTGPLRGEHGCGGSLSRHGALGYCPVGCRFRRQVSVFLDVGRSTMERRIWPSAGCRCGSGRGAALCQIRRATSCMPTITASTAISIPAQEARSMLWPSWALAAKQRPGGDRPHHKDRTQRGDHLWMNDYHETLPFPSTSRSSRSCCATSSRVCSARTAGCPRSESWSRPSALAASRSGRH